LLIVGHTTKQMKHACSWNIQICCPSVEMSSLGLRPRDDMSTSRQHIWMFHLQPCIICILSPIDNSLTKLNTGAQLQTFPYPTASKLFLYSIAFMAKLGTQSLTFKSVTNKQTNRQTEKKTQRFCPPRRWVKSEPHQTWRGDRGSRARSCTSKTFGVWRKFRR